jgi:hypothetical protein
MPAIVERMSKDLDAWSASVNRRKTGADYRKLDAVTMR